MLKDLMKKRYIVSKQLYTSYTDTADLTPLELDYIFGFISEEQQRYEDIKQNKE